MNCKQGDLAIIVKSDYGNEGKIVKCIMHYTEYEYDVWEVDIRLNCEFGGYTNSIIDSYLRPIRDSDKEDEMLKIVNITEEV